MEGLLNLTVPLIMAFVAVYAAIRRVDVYDGLILAKDAIETIEEVYGK